MRRLVYSPYVNAYVKLSTGGVFDLSPYIVSGSVNRKLNQVSSAQLTIRNPPHGDSQNLLFTDHIFADNEEPGPLFHPMDPIVIVMQRLQNQALTVFTGYIDTSPYIQLYPGLCTIEASCTLKRLAYTQWDASLPAVTDLLAQFGWVSDTTGIWNPTAETGKVTGNGAGGINGSLTDGSLGALLFVILNQIGQWDPSVIWIEQLPKEILPLAVQLYQNIQPEVQTGSQAFTSLLTSVLGTASLGTGSAAGTGSAPSGKYSLRGSNPVTHYSWAVSLLKNIGAPINDTNVGAIVSWENREGGNWNNSATFNPINTTQTEPGATNIAGNPDGVKAYVSWAQGMQATVTTLYNGDYNDILTSLRAGNGLANASTGLATWSGNSYSAIIAGSSTSVAKDDGAEILASSIVPTSGTTKISTSPSATADTPIYTIAKLLSGKSPGGKKGDTSTTEASATGSNASGVMSVYNTIVEAANVINAKKYPYVWGGGEDAAGQPSTGVAGDPSEPSSYYQTHTGFDCAGAVAAVLCAANGALGIKYGDPVGGDVDLANLLTTGGYMVAGADTSPGAVNIYHLPGKHIYMSIDGHFFAAQGTNEGPVGFYDGSDFEGTAYHIPSSKLNSSTTYNFPLGTGNNVKPGGAGNGPGTNLTGGTGSADSSAFSTMLALPSLYTLAEAVAFTGKRSFIADSPLYPFIDQVARASMRSYCSMPNGNFFAFFPDYFGLFGRAPYWSIDDIEIIDARIDLSDNALVTNMAVAGDLFDQGSVTFPDLVLTAGIFDIFDAIATGYVGNDGAVISDKFDPNAGYGEAVAFLQRYGARPYVEEVPAIRSPIYELFLAFQNWMLAWSKQFLTTFELTFMPELFPGGRILLKKHNIELYIEEVAHTFDYVNGFTTMVNVSSPVSAKNAKNGRVNTSHGLLTPTLSKTKSKSASAHATTQSSTKSPSQKQS